MSCQYSLALCTAIGDRQRTRGEEQETVDHLRWRRRPRMGGELELHSGRQQASHSPQWRTIGCAS